MATYNNKHWLLSNIRNSFISTDDTGMCETLMLTEDMPSQYAILCKTHNANTSDSNVILSSSSKSLESYLFYPGLEQSDEDDLDPTAQSYDIQMDQDIGFHQRQRSNTAQKLEQMNLAKKRLAKIKIIKCDELAPNVSELEKALLFTKKQIVPNLNEFTEQNNKTVNTDNLIASTTAATTETSIKPSLSRLADKLTESSRQIRNKYFQYARFDGTAHLSTLTKKIKIFMTMFPEQLRNYPLEVCVISTAKIHEFIGLICYKSSITNPEIQLLSVENYGLYITEEDGEIDMEFPPLDLREPCSKFCFSHLSLAQRKLSADYRQDSRTLSMTSEVESIFHETIANSTKQTEDLAKMLGHTTMMEAPLYRSYRVRMITKGLFKTEIQLGVSGEKLEIDPIQPQNSFWSSRQKAISHCMDSIAWCEITSDASAYNATLRIVYSISSSSQQFDNIMPSSSLSSSTKSSAATMATFKHYDFVTNAETAREIVQKINNIIEVRSSGTRREYLTKRSITSGKGNNQSDSLKRTSTGVGSSSNSGTGSGGSNGSNAMKSNIIGDKRKLLGKISPKKKPSV